MLAVRVGVLSFAVDVVQPCLRRAVLCLPCSSIGDVWQTYMD